MQTAIIESCHCQLGEIVDAAPMSPSFSIDRETGSIGIGDSIHLKPDEHRVTVVPQVSDLVDRSRDYGNGYEWLYLHGLTFGSRPAHLSLCFHENLLKEASWGVRLAGAETDGGWPTREAIDAEVVFVLRTLTEEMGICAGPFSWGEIWSNFDAKGFMAASGLRYRRP